MAAGGSTNVGVITSIAGSVDVTFTVMLPVPMLPTQSESVRTSPSRTVMDGPPLGTTSTGPARRTLNTYGPSELKQPRELQNGSAPRAPRWNEPALGGLRAR